MERSEERGWKLEKETKLLESIFRSAICLTPTGRGETMNQLSSTRSIGHKSFYNMAASTHVEIKFSVIPSWISHAWKLDVTCADSRFRFPYPSEEPRCPTYLFSWSNELISTSRRLPTGKADSTDAKEDGNGDQLGLGPFVAVSSPSLESCSLCGASRNWMRWRKCRHRWNVWKHRQRKKSLSIRSSKKCSTDKVKRESSLRRPSSIRLT